MTGLTIGLCRFLNWYGCQMAWFVISYWQRTSSPLALAIRFWAYRLALGPLSLDACCALRYNRPAPGQLHRHRLRAPGISTGPQRTQQRNPLKGLLCTLVRVQRLSWGLLPFCCSLSQHDESPLHPKIIKQENRSNTGNNNRTRLLPENLPFL